MEKSKNLSLTLLCAFCLLFAMSLLSAPAMVVAQSPSEELEREAQAIDKMIMCPVCPAETIDQAQVEISFQMRAVIREMLAEGRTREEILDYFVDRYGADILAAPPKSGANLVAWILPIAGVVAGVAVLFLVIRSMTGRRNAAVAVMPGAPPAGVSGSEVEAVPEGESVEQRGLAPYLEIVDRNLATRRSMAAPTGGLSSPASPVEGEGTGSRESGADG